MTGKEERKWGGRRIGGGECGRQGEKNKGENTGMIRREI